MRMYQIVIDEEVYNYLKGKAEPFVDTPNSILRRELLGEKGKTKQGQHVSRENTMEPFPPIPAGTPKALEQILQVIYLVRNLNLSRSMATHRVAAKHQVATQTIIDKYTRQLNLTAKEFDKLIEQPGLTDLKNILLNKFGEHQVVIKKYFGDEI